MRWAAIFPIMSDVNAHKEAWGSPLKFCSRCVMDGTDPDITFDSQGICNHCTNALRELMMAEMEKKNLLQRIERIKSDGKGKEYDCLIGLSGGADSSTVLHHAVELGLRPLCFSVDNSWNDPRADENLMRMVEKLKVRLVRCVLDKRDFLNLQVAFMRAGLINIEIPTDHVLMAVGFDLASTYGIKWILSGGNVATESIMPASWSYNARDLTHIKDVYKKMMGRGLSGVPTCGVWKWNWYKWIRRIKTLYLLDYLDYNRAESIKMLGEKYGYQNYGEKHCENYFTWWFQNFYLFTKWGIDKRKAHLSALINSGQMTRKEAMEILRGDPEYPKLGLEQKSLGYTKHSHSDFRQDKWYGRIAKFVRLWR